MTALLQLCEQGNVWLPWKRVTKDGRAQKVALKLNGRWASVAREEDWQGYRHCEAYVESLGASGLCFNVGLTPFTVMDIDRTDSPLVQAFVKYFDSYTETSPSGNGLHVIVKGELPADHVRKVSDFFGKGFPLEVYQADRYLTWTGNQVGDAGRIEDRQDKLDLLYEKRLKGREGTGGQAVGRLSFRSDGALLEAIESRLEYLAAWQGGGDDGSQNDWALILLLKRLGASSEQADRLFRQSGCYRAKWDCRRGRLTYGQLTIQRAKLGEEQVH